MTRTHMPHQWIGAIPEYIKVTKQAEMYLKVTV